VCYVRKSSCFSDPVVDTRKKSLSSGLGLVEGTGTCNRDWMIPLFHSVFNFSVTFSRVVFPSDGEWWLRLLPTSYHRRPSAPAPWHERRASFVGRDLVNRQPLPVQPIAIARAILVPSFSPTWLSSSAPPKNRALSPCCRFFPSCGLDSGRRRMGPVLLSRR